MDTRSTHSNTPMHLCFHVHRSICPATRPSAHTHCPQPRDNFPAHYTHYHLIPKAQTIRVHAPLVAISLSVFHTLQRPRINTLTATPASPSSQIVRRDDCTAFQLGEHMAFFNSANLRHFRLREHTGWSSRRGFLGRYSRQRVPFL